MSSSLIGSVSLNLKLKYSHSPPTIVSPVYMRLSITQRNIAKPSPPEPPREAICAQPLKGPRLKMLKVNQRAHWMLWTILYISMKCLGGLLHIALNPA
mmetsp:Transcript_22348/g.25682  ORF Transcript_22348/g.25682 Transcript_22348/m.25682 type:complete len:98 (-) Transcript_22348:371-664(-)